MDPDLRPGRILVAFVTKSWPGSPIGSTFSSRECQSGCLALSTSTDSIASIVSLALFLIEPCTAGMLALPQSQWYHWPKEGYQALALKEGHGASCATHGFSQKKNSHWISGSKLPPKGK
jgi:hypothetical protein